MSQIFPDTRLIRISKATQKDIEYWKEGVSLQHDADKTIPQLICLVASDRWRLAYQIRYHANKLLRSKPAHYRSSISRYYYTMYHAMRACAYVYYEGDDFSSHSKLPLSIPEDFPNGADDWQRKLKYAHLIRNRADYDPYPKSDKAWQKYAYFLKTDADQLLRLARTYLQNKGCNI